METKSLIENYYKAFNEKNWKQLLSYLSEDVVHDINQGQRDFGKNKFESFLADMDKYYDEKLSNITIMVDGSGKHASAEFICTGVYKTSCAGLPPARNQKYELPVGCFFDVKDGMITRVTNYYNMKVWLDQVN